MNIPAMSAKRMAAIKYPHQHGRGLLFDLQARHERRLSALLRKAPAPLFGEFDFRYSNRVGLGVNDEARAEKALQGIAGKRLTYRRPRKAHVN